MNFDIAALVIYILIFYIHFSRSRSFTMQAGFFTLLLYSAFIALVLDMLSVWIIRFSGNFLLLPQAILLMYHLIHNSLPIIFCCFILALCGYLPLSKLRVIILVFPWTAALVAIGSGSVFSLEKPGVYQQGLGIHVLYITAFIYLGFSLLVLIHHWRSNPKIMPGSALVFVSFFLIPVIIQYLYPDVLVQSLGIAFALLFMLLTFYDFDRYTDHSGKLYNRLGLAVRLELMRRKKQKAEILVINLNTVEFLLTVLGSDVFSRIEQHFELLLEAEIRRGLFVAKSGTGKYIMVSGEKNYRKNPFQRVLDIFSTPWILQDRKYLVSVHLCRLSFPLDVSDTQDIFRIQYQLTKQERRFRPNSFVPLHQLALADSKRQNQIIDAINHALTHDGFDVYYQPIVALADCRAVGAEALVRLRDKNNEFIAPDEFIPLAEQNGSIHRIGDVVIEKACAFLSSLRAQGLALEFMDINLSVLQCMQANLAARIKTIVSRYHLSPSDICFEITESTAGLLPSVHRNFEELQKCGFGIAIDDFGTGFSNLAGLLIIPFRSVKLDRSLINGMTQAEDSRSGVASMIRMFRHLETVIVAEGIESLEQLKELRKLNVNQLQGYLISRPLPEKDFLAFMSRKEQLCI